MAEHIELTVKVDAYAPSDDRPPGEPHVDNPEPNPEWKALTDDEQKAVYYLVSSGLRDLLSRVEQWVPVSFRLETGGRLDVTIQFDLADIDQTVTAEQTSLDREEQRMVFELAKMQERLG